MPELPRSLETAYQVAAAELGWCSAARLFARELADAGGADLVVRAAERLGREFPVFACVAERFVAGALRGDVDATPAATALTGTRRVVVVGLETDHLDALVARLPDVELGLVTTASGTEPDWRRVLANYAPRVVPVELGDVQRWSGRHSALLTFVYGADAHLAHVLPAWLRVSGSDVRTQFHTLAGWDVLGVPMVLYPRWLVATSTRDFSHLVRA
ncbi:MAG: hypothetical protein IT385_06585 [Deltaproteobacteria bacterium]|nr:hypothetical protein [Deltaproteobacteria bacterium]